MRKRIHSEIQAGFSSAAAASVERLYSRYHSAMVKAAYRVVQDSDLAQDVVQETFINLFLKIDRLTVTPVWQPYLVKAAVNRALNMIRDQRAKSVVAQMASYQQEGRAKDSLYAPSADQEIILEQIITLVNDILKQLPPKMRQCFILSREYGYSITEIARIEQISSRSVAKNIARVVRLIKLQLH